MSQFKPCQGKQACRDDGKRCLTCGRSLKEIYKLRDLIAQMTALAIEYDYDNIDDYANYIGQKVHKSIVYHQQQLEES